MTRAGVALALAFLAAGCGNDSMMQIGRGQTSPDEFAILPSKPMTMPPNFNTLPPPDLSGVNRTDVNPQADAVAALGGNPARLNRDGRTPDNALIRQTTRYGVQPNIRGELAVADAEYRSKHRGRLLERFFQVPTYYTAYEPLELNQYGALERYRRAGAPTPAAPPDPAAD